MEILHPLHPSMRSHVIRRSPRNMASIAIGHDANETLTKIALEIFTDCVNAGKPLQDTLLAIYLSGMENAIQAQKDNTP